jgi:site-specific DNA-methyltransferase (adenine-specific)
MQLVALTDIEVPIRQRSEIDAKGVSELEASILSVGLLHPPVCWFDETKQKWVLTVGETRLRAIQSLSKRNLCYWHGGTPVNPGEIPITPLGDYLDAVGRFEAELDENLRRTELSWQDRCRAHASLHEMRKKQNKKQTLTDTALELITKNPNYNSVSGTTRAISEATIIAEHLSNPKIAAARSQNEAYGLVLKMQEEKALAVLSKRNLITLSKAPDLEIRHGDCTTILPGLEGEFVDLILADPPYGIGAGSAGFRARTIHHHNYEDTLEAAQELAQCILTEGFRICKPRANILIFCDIELFDWLKQTSANMGWVPFKRPIIWRKSESEGMAPWGGSGPRITTEFIFYATKGQRGMVTSPTDVFEDKRVSRNERLHAAEKPVTLLTKLIQCTTLPGDLVLDPCCGSGSAIVACRDAGRRGLGIEKDLDYYNTALANLSKEKTA